MKTYSTINDPVFVRPEYTKTDRFFLQFIKDERDLPFIYLTIKLSLILIPMAVVLFLPMTPSWFWWPLAIIFTYFSNVKYRGPFGLMLHCTSHRKWFKNEYNFVNHYLPWFLSLFFGQTPESYFVHHIGMHHPENNLEEDESSTMGYQRDSFKEFLKYYGDFIVLGLYRVTGYFRRKNRKKLYRRILTGEFLYLLMCIGLCFVNWPATVVVFIFPFFAGRFIMMLGNWTQHAFVDHDEPDNLYKSSITCVNVKYNKLCWNDGYHISHHIKPTLHWSEHPLHLKNNKEEYAKNKAIIFDGIDFLGVFIHLMKKRYDVLADHCVNINNTFKSKEELVALLKERTKRFEMPA